ncbi:hypothetical protein ATK74_2036 [Propionicimonas paludicola]|uniref:O-antigen ligase-like membrane protein n=1 Tax=Propionicimonas paludicola TaxID=185243 RepID=A0A2A9CTS8_9ACTN|nr:hypothetical protein [Propionicimonas paludicola]PFG17465.1 hypothetical protein ATK74_2036 [Propionicimonas paludicola]
MPDLPDQRSGRRIGDEYASVWACGLVFLAFFPYPAVFSLGNSWGFQAAQLVCLLLLVVRLPHVIKTRSAVAYFWLVGPILLAYGLAAFANQLESPDTAFRTFIVTAVTLLALPVFGDLLRSFVKDWLPFPVAIAMMINLALAIYQIIEFGRGVFPFIEYFHNPSFADLQSITDVYTAYVARPGGVFPEPSAMSACLGPWGIVLLGNAVDAKGRYRVISLVGAFAAGVAVVLSTSVYVVVVMAGYAAVLLFSRYRSAMALGAVAALGAVIWGVSLVPSSGRLSSGGDASTQYRYEALVSALQLPMESFPRLLAGFGPGQGVAALGSSNHGISAVVSILMSWWLEGGLIVAVGVVALVVMAWRRAETSSARIALVAWLVSVGATTGYLALLPLWLLLAFILDCGGRFRSRDEPAVPAATEFQLTSGVV